MSDGADASARTTPVGSSDLQFNTRSEPPAIELINVARRDPKTEGWLIHDVSVSLRFGERLGIVGRSGAGKTVLLRAMALLDPLDLGTIHWRGNAVRGEAVPSYRSQVIYLHQRPALTDGSVADNLRYPFELAVHRDRTYDRQRVVALLEALGRDARFLEKPSRDLSGGEAQLVALIRAVQLDPAVLLLDEPTASLDLATAHAVEETIGRWLDAPAADAGFHLRQP